MHQYKDIERIVVGVDGSERSRLALAWAVREARAHDAEVHVVTVARPDVLVDPTWMALPPAVDLDLEAKRIQAEAMEEVDTEGLSVTEARPFGSPARCLLDAAEGADLLVVGSRGLGAFARRLLGSVSHQVVTHATMPVLVVPDRIPPINRVVVGVDGSQHSLRALRWARDLARVHDAELEAVASFQWPLQAVTSPWVPPVDGPSYEELQDRLRARLDEAVDGVTGDDPSVVRTVLDGPPSQRLLERAEDADVLVVGSRGFGGFKGLLLGSTSQACLTHSPCPVAIVPTVED